MTDLYDVNAEYLDVLLFDVWQQLAAPVVAALDGVGRCDGTIVDIGAGTGLGTALIARALPEAPVLALEPNRYLRTVLLSHVRRDGNLRERVTVSGDPIQSATLPDTLRAAVGMNMLGHLNPADRRKLWSTLSERLAPGGRGVFNLIPPDAPQVVDAQPPTSVWVGNRCYEGTARAEPSGDGVITWEMTYRTYEDDRVVDEFAASGPWWVMTEEQWRDELNEHSLDLTLSDETTRTYVVSRTHA